MVGESPTAGGGSRMGRGTVGFYGGLDWIGKRMKGNNTYPLSCIEIRCRG